MDVVADTLIVAGAAVAASSAAAARLGGGRRLREKRNLSAACQSAAAATQAAAGLIDSKEMLLPVSLPPLENASGCALAEGGVSSSSFSFRGGAAAVAEPNSPEAVKAACRAAAAGKPGVYVVHSCSSGLNPTFWGDLLKHGREYSMLYPYYARLSRTLQSPFFDTDFEKFKR